MRSKCLRAIPFLIGLASSDVYASYIDGFSIQTANAGPNGIAESVDGKLWFTESWNNSIGNFDLHTSVMGVELPLPHVESFPTSIVTGTDGNLWFTESENRRIGSVVPPSTIVEFDLPSGIVSGDALAVDPAGFIWFSIDTAAGAGLARISTDSKHTIQIYALPASANIDEVSGLVVGADGNLWFTESSFDHVGRAINPRVAHVQLTDAMGYAEFPIDGVFVEPRSITIGADGNFWFSSRVGVIGRVLSSSPYTITQFSTDGAYPSGITRGPDGAIWYACNGHRAIGAIDETGAIVEFNIPALAEPGGIALAEPVGIVSASDKNVWFTDQGRNQIGVVRLDGIFKDRFESGM